MSQPNTTLSQTLFSSGYLSMHLHYSSGIVPAVPNRSAMSIAPSHDIKRAQSALIGQKYAEKGSPKETRKAKTIKKKRKETKENVAGSD